MSPTRELALQTLKFTKEVTNGLLLIMYLTQVPTLCVVDEPLILTNITDIHVEVVKIPLS